jgi:hypothetical protein
VRSSVKALRRPPTPADTQGLAGAHVVVAAPLGATPPTPQPGRFGLVAFWEDEPSLDAFLTTHPLAEELAEGWSVRLDPLRAVSVAGGHWPGIPDHLPADPTLGGDGPAVVLTIGRLRLPRIVPFLRASRRAEKQVLDAPGLLWGTGFANLTQHLVSTFSLWESGAQTHAYASSSSGHTSAMSNEKSRSFHHVGSFVRFRPYAARGSLAGRNPLPEAVAAKLNGTPLD